ncbi:MAG: hypothetical protein K9W45_06800 [Candidatus Heimdallarchaeum aukensis]|uniref:Uncharacterized protein n=1 Tax=Candidatus Heimdallarchaeum aukensis TaxID=2876573 RepID=A0A9Y1BIR1_9ARCH|nr:MAG: hypothetical protein K9W45_06800 [Candidatus Heimdallarchaeum aukensis]
MVTFRDERVSSKRIKERVKSLEIRYKRSTREWWIYFHSKVLPSSFLQGDNLSSDSSFLPPAVLGIDLGINIPAVEVLLTPKKKVTSKEIKF